MTLLFFKIFETINTYFLSFEFFQLFFGLVIILILIIIVMGIFK